MDILLLRIRKEKKIDPDFSSLLLFERNNDGFNSCLFFQPLSNDSPIYTFFPDFSQPPNLNPTWHLSFQVLQTHQTQIALQTCSFLGPPSETGKHRCPSSWPNRVSVTHLYS